MKTVKEIAAAYGATLNIQPGTIGMLQLEGMGERVVAAIIKDICPQCRLDMPVIWYQSQSAGEGWLHEQPWGWCRANRVRNILGPPKPEQIKIEPPRKPKKVVPQPEWLRKQALGFEDGHKWSVFIDGKDFAVVREPGSYWSDNGGRHYGAVAFHLTKKVEIPTNAAMAIRRALPHDGGRVSKEKKAYWEMIVAEADRIGKIPEKL